MTYEPVCDCCGKRVFKSKDELYLIWYKPSGNWRIPKGDKPKHLCMKCAKKIKLTKEQPIWK